MSKLFSYLAELYVGPVLGWVDITADVRGDVTITRGRTSEGSRADRGRCTLRLDNLSGDYSPRNPAGAYYGLLGRNTPIRIGTGLAADAFGRTESSGWGTADSGQTWTVSGSAAADFSVSSGLARHAQPSKNIVRISRLGEDWRDVEQVTEASIPAVALGASVVVGHVARYSTTSGDYYWLRMEFNPAGTMTAKISRNAGGDIAVAADIPGLTYTAGQSWTFRSSVSGSHLAVKMWPTGTAEPVDWTLTATDRTLTTGRAGIATWVVLGNTNTTEVRFDNYQAALRRFYGEVAAWPPGWNLPGTVRYVDVEAAGVLQRLGQGEQPKWSPLRRTIDASGPAVYYPAEDGVLSTAAGAAVGGQGQLVVSGTVAFDPVNDYNAGSTRYGTTALGNLAAGGSLAASFGGDVAAATAAAWTVHTIGRFDVAYSSGDIVLMEWTTGGTYNRWQLVENKTTLHTQVIAYHATTGAATVAVDRVGVLGGFRMWAVSAEQVGGNITVTYWIDSGTDTLTGSIPGTVGGVTSLAVNPTGTTSTQPMPFGHLAVWGQPTIPYRVDGLVDSYGGVVLDAFLSYAGEPAHVRLARLADEEGIPVTVPAVDAVAVTRMGPQPAAKIGELLDECADADGGYLFESRDALGLAFRPRDSLYNQTPVPIAYVGQLAAPFAPVDDADDVRNDVTVKRTEGSSARAVQTEGRLAALPPPDGAGVYRTEVTLNLADDAGLADQAGWRVHLGTVDRPRYPQLSVQLAAPEWQADPAGMAAVLAVDTGDVLEVTGLPTWAAGDARTLVTGYTETISEYRWQITFAGVPAQPWDVAEIDGDARVAMDGGTLAAAVTAASTTLSLASTPTGGLWTTDPLDFPLDLRVGEERVTVSAISGASSPQTATVSARAVNGVAAGWAAGTEVDVWLPAVVAL